MPLVRVVTSVSITSEQKSAELLTRLSQAAASHFGKPERWVMTCLDCTAKMMFAGSTDPTCYIEVKNIGTMTAELTERLSQELCEIVTAELAIPSSRIYVEFTAAEGHLWGWDGSTFA